MPNDAEMGIWFLFMELKSDLHEHMKTQGIKQAEFILKREIQTPSIDIESGKVPEKTGIINSLYLCHVDYSFCFARIPNNICNF